MMRIPVRSSGGGYDVVIERGALRSLGRFLSEAGLNGGIRLVSDSNVFVLHGVHLEGALRSDGFSVASFQIEPGEESKSQQGASRLYDWLLDVGTERRDVVIALGGGVVGDLAGFVAATYMRGLRLVQVPTSLLAQVDSSVGGKVAVNHPRGKNLIGAFYPPSLVVVDPATLSSLPARELSAALAEVVKMGIILDPELVDLLDRKAESVLRLDAAVLEEVISRSIELKAGVVEEDEKESGLRAILNYGHTIGHGIEAASDYSLYRHGEAVAIGMQGAARLAVEMGLCEPDLLQRQENLLWSLGLPLFYQGLPVGRILEAMSKDKKAARGKLTWVLPERIGKVVIRRDVPESSIERVVMELAG